MSVKFTHLFFILALATLRAEASHVLGGNINLVLLPNGKHELAAYIYQDALSIVTPNLETIFATIYRRKTNAVVFEILMFRQEISDVKVINPKCSFAIEQKPVQARYTSGGLAFPVDVFSDPEGYYIVWEQCCRNSNVANISRAGVVGMVFPLEIGPIFQNGQAVKNSTPEFSQPAVQYLCVGQPFQVSFAAKDPDGDDLRYSLATPWLGFTSPAGQFGPSRQKGPFPKITWNTGFDSTRAIPGSPALNLNSRNGLMAVTPTRAGWFVVSVRCEEFRAGNRLSISYIEFLYLVQDCPDPVPTPVNIEVKYASRSVTFRANTDGHVPTIGLCVSDTVVLQTDENSDFALQWFKNGKPIAGATKPFVSVREAGVYSIQKKFRDGCLTTKIAERSTNLNFKSNDVIVLKPGRQVGVCDNQRVDLVAEVAEKVEFQWTRQGQVGVVSTTATVANVSTSGKYFVSIINPRTQCVNKDSVIVRTGTTPSASLTASGKTTLCDNEKLVLTANAGSTFSYIWFRNNEAVVQSKQNQFQPLTSGEYSVLVIDTTSFCDRRSENINVQISTAPKVTLDSIPPFCQTPNSQTVALIGAPAGGTFSGTGVVGANFNASVSGAGQHLVSYSLQNALGCVGRAQRVVVVNALPDATIKTSNRTNICEGDTLFLSVEAGASLRYEWFLNETPLPQSTTNQIRATAAGNYRVTVTNPQGNCVRASGPVRVQISPSTVAFLDSIPPVCGSKSQTVALKGTPAGGVFSGVGITGSVFNPGASGNGTFRITYTFQNQFGCVSRAARTVLVSAPPQITLPSALLIKPGESVQIVSEVAGNGQYEWFPKTGLNNFFTPRPIATPAATTKYRLQANFEGCINEAEVTIYVLDFDIPNGFTPNSDGINDDWELKGLEVFPQYRLEVFNRWGSLLFSSDDVTKRWDGRFDGQDVPSGTYYYVISFGELAYNLSGNVSVIR